ncbi:MAG TPA: PKD domain-containing protein [Bacteroidia bacterium]|nr:PKD domain-containing protein [Bacteroidia bacterium]
MGTTSTLKKMVVHLVFILATSFSLTAQNQVGLVSPSATAVLNDTTVRFDWDPLLTATSYQFQLSSNLSFSSVLKDTTLAESSLSIPGFSVGNYYWRVRAIIGGSPASWSKVNDFKIISLKAITSLKMWWDSSDSLVVNASNQVQRWGDKSGNNNYGFQLTANAQPIKVDSVLNNKPVLTFDGKLQSLVTNPFNYSQPNTFFMIFNKKLSTYNNYMCDGGGANQFRLGTVGGNQYVFYAGDFFNIGNAGPDGYKMFTLRENGPKSFCRNNFALLGSGDPGANVMKGFTLGAFGIPDTDPDSHAEMDVAEVILFNDTLPLAQMIDIENYLRYKYAPPVSLGKDVIQKNSFCPVKLSPQGSYASYLWSTGATTKTITVSALGSYWIKVTDKFGFTSSDTIKLLSYPVINTISDSVSICEGDSVVWNTGLNKKDFTFLWTSGTTDSLIAIKQAGTYFVTVSDKFGCNKPSKSTKVTIDNYPSLVSLGNDTAFCSGNKIALVAGASQTVSYLWNDNSTGNSLIITATGQYSVITKSLHCTAMDTINITVSGKAPMADFSANSTCLGAVNTFTDLSVPPAGESISLWKWDFGDLQTSNSQNVTHAYADTGTYVVKLTVTTPSGCAAVETKTIHVYPNPKLDFTTSLTCNEIAVQFTDKSTAFGYPITQWNWSFADPSSGTSNSSVKQNPTHNFANAGVYLVKLVAKNSKGCVDSTTKNVTINPRPITDFDYSIPCKGQTVSFTDKTTLPSGTTNVANYWNFETGTSTLLNPQQVFSSNVSYTVLHIVTASNGCKDSMIKTIDVHAAPTARFASSTGCVGSPTAFTDQSLISSGTITGWKWTFEDIGNSTVKNPSYNFTKAGNATVKQVVISDFGCKDSTTKTIVIYPKPTARFTVSPDYGNPGQLVKFTNTSLNAVTYIWDFNDNSSSTLANPSHVYKDTGIYRPMLVAVSTYGCKDTVKSKVTILKRFLDVAITNTLATVQNGGGMLLNDYLNVHVDLLNKSTSDIFTLDLYMETNDGPGIKETWTGKWLKGDVLSYDFKTTPNLKEGGHFVCVYAVNPNGVADEVPMDNKLCKALDESEFEVLPPYPNPTEDKLLLSLIIPTKGELSIMTYNSQGEPMRPVYSGSIAQGLQVITIDTQGFAVGLYICKVELDGKIIITKFFKK